MSFDNPESILPFHQFIQKMVHRKKHFYCKSSLFQHIIFFLSWSNWKLENQLEEKYSQEMFTVLGYSNFFEGSRKAKKDFLFSLLVKHEQQFFNIFWFIQYNPSLNKKLLKRTCFMLINELNEEYASCFCHYLFSCRFKESQDYARLVLSL